MKLVDDLRAGNPVQPTRGPNHVPTFKENEHLLAGFEDGLVDEGESAGVPTLLGKRIAAEIVWGIPSDPGLSAPEPKEGE